MDYMAIQTVICVFLRTAVVRPVPISPTSAPRMTVYKVPDVLLQPPKIKTDTFRKTSSGSSPQTRAEAWRTSQRVDPNRSKSKAETWRRIPGMSLNPVTPIVPQTKTDALRRSQGINPSMANKDTFKNISGITPDQVKPKISNTIAKTSTEAQSLGHGRPALGKPNLQATKVLLFTETFF